MILFKLPLKIVFFFLMLLLFGLGFTMRALSGIRSLAVGAAVLLCALATIMAGYIFFTDMSGINLFGFVLIIIVTAVVGLAGALLELLTEGLLLGAEKLSYATFQW